MKAIKGHLEELVDIQVIAAIEIHEIQCVVNVSKPLCVVFAHI